MFVKVKDMETPLFPKLNIRSITLSQAHQLALKRCQVMLKRCGNSNGQLEAITSKSEENSFNKHANKHKEKETQDARNAAPFAPLRKIERITVSTKLTTGQNQKKDKDCVFCGKEFPCWRDLERHSRTHTKERPHACSECSSTFAQHSTLTSHKLVCHSKKKEEFICDFCDNRYYVKSSLIKHQNRRHLDLSSSVSSGPSARTEDPLKSHPWISPNQRQKKAIKDEMPPTMKQDGKHLSKRATSEPSATSEPGVTSEEMGDGRKALCSEPHCKVEDTPEAVSVYGSTEITENQQGKILTQEPPALDRHDHENGSPFEEPEEAQSTVSSESSCCSRDTGTTVIFRQSSVLAPKNTATLKNKGVVSGIKGVRKRRSTGCPDCIFCDKKFVALSQLEIHIRCHTREQPFSCSICSASFSQRGGLKDHKLRIHSNPAKTFCCQFCEKPFYFKGDLNVHERRHRSQKAYHCDFFNCNKSFVTSSNLNQHKLVHSTERPFKCYLCKKGFARKYDLEVHCRYHTGEKPYTCHVCGKQHYTSYALKAHKCKLRKHEPPELGRFHCLFCQKVCVAKLHFEEHISKHTKEMPHVCLVCGKSFRYTSSFRTHCKAKGHRHQELIAG